jgi:hypothetical protein
VRIVSRPRIVVGVKTVGADQALAADILREPISGASSLTTPSRPLQRSKACAAAKLMPQSQLQVRRVRMSRIAASDTP